MDILTSLIYVTVAGLVVLVAYIQWIQSFWQRRNVPYVKPMFLIGNFGKLLLRKRALPYLIQDIYNEINNKGDKFGGVYQLLLPVLMVTDPKLIQDITVKYFDHFVDRRPLATKKSDELIARSLLVLGAEEWRPMRHALSPAFTGSKLRAMTELMSDTGRQFARYLTNLPQPAEINIREAFRRFATDVIATTAYGTVFDSVNNPDNEFFKQSSKILDTTGTRGLILAGYIVSPKLMEILNVSLIPKNIKEYFFNIILGSIKYREECNKTRPDMIQLLMDARKKQLESEDGTYIFNDLDIVAQAVTFFLAGFESVTTTLSFCALEIAAHPEIQQKLVEELDSVLQTSNGEVTFEVLQNLKYMEMVVSEVLRMYPGIPMSDRVCTKHFEIPEISLSLEPGTTISIPIYALHHDPKYFPEPEKFDPERFSEENKQKLTPSTYIPFGAGPRNCIGMRFSILEVKLCLAHVLATCKLDVCARTCLPIRLSPSAPLIAPEGDFWLSVKQRSDPSLKLD